MSGASRCGPSRSCCYRISQQHPERTTRLLAAAGLLGETIGCPIAPIDRDDAQAVSAAARSALGDAAFTRAWANGRDLTMAQAVAAALASQADHKGVIIS
ncbi:MAG: hypothetical protein M3439_13150 [Chloroflexota bacterium]|nr:hypothetical protein [Chloroflexota bacterium]